jgi:hypothetical protein
MLLTVVGSIRFRFSIKDLSTLASTEELKQRRDILIVDLIPSDRGYKPWVFISFIKLSVGLQPNTVATRKSFTNHSTYCLTEPLKYNTIYLMFCGPCIVIYPCNGTSISILLATSRHKRMTYTNCCIYRKVPSDDEQ